MKDAIVRLFSSSKALVVMFVVVLSFAALFIGRASWDQVEAFVKWVVSALIVGQSLEDSARHFANRPQISPSVSNTFVSPSTPPPPQ